MGENEECQIANPQPSEGLEPSEGFFSPNLCGLTVTFPTPLSNGSDTPTNATCLCAINLVDNLPDWRKCCTHVAHCRKALESEITLVSRPLRCSEHVQIIDFAGAGFVAAGYVGDMDVANQVDVLRKAVYQVTFVDLVMISVKGQCDCRIVHFSDD